MSPSPSRRLIRTAPSFEQFRLRKFFSRTHLQTPFHFGANAPLFEEIFTTRFRLYCRRADIPADISPTISRTNFAIFLRISPRNSPQKQKRGVRHSCGELPSSLRPFFLPRFYGQRCLRQILRASANHDLERSRFHHLLHFAVPERQFVKSQLEFHRLRFAWI